MPRGSRPVERRGGRQNTEQTVVADDQGCDHAETARVGQATLLRGRGEEMTNCHRSWWDLGALHVSNHRNWMTNCSELGSQQGDGVTVRFTDQWLIYMRTSSSGH